MNTDTKRLLHHFRNVDVYEGQRGDLDNASPAQSAIRVMVERKQKITELEAEVAGLRKLLPRPYRSGQCKYVGHVGMDELRHAVQEARQYAVEIERLRRATPILDERDRQDAKWGIRDHTLPVWMTILMEEVGELAEAVLELQFGQPEGSDHFWRIEAVHVAAVALAMLELHKESEESENK